MKHFFKNITNAGLLPADSFPAYLRSQKKLLIIAGCISILVFILLKWLYPLPDFFVDSMGYVSWAISGQPVGYRPMGYSIFLRLLHDIVPSGGFVVLVQYLVFVFTTLLCFFSTDYLFRLPPGARLILLVASLCNPLLVIQANVISSDSLFCSLTVCWFTLGLWMIRKQQWWAVLLHIVCLYFCFQVRYTAIFFPIVSIIAFLFLRAQMHFKILYIAVTAGLVWFSIERQKNAAEAYTSVRVFSGFAGWQLANNVLCYYQEINIDREDFPDPECVIIDKYVRGFIDSIYEKNYVGTKYLWDARSPLKQYLMRRVKYFKRTYFIEWMDASTALGQYGWTIIKHDPGAFFRYFILENAKFYFYPDPEFLKQYNEGGTRLTDAIRDWYHYEGNDLYCTFPELQKGIVRCYLFISLLLNVFNIAAILFFLVKCLPARKKISREAWSMFLAWSIFYFGFMAFSIFSTIVSLRYLDPIFVLGLVMPFVLLYRIRTLAKDAQDENAQGNTV